MLAVATSPPGTGNESTVLSALANRVPPDWKSAVLAIGSAAISLSGTGTIVAAVPGKRIKVFCVKLIVDAAMSVNLKDGSTAMEGVQAIAKNGGYTEYVTPPAFLFQCSVNSALGLTISGAGNVGGRVSYWLEDSVP